jgi:thymidylate synthase (FAD)
METKLISITPDAEKLIAYCARVSNPNQQDREDFAKLISYCIKHQHWSIFEQGYMTVEISTTRAIAAQILRHRSFTFQEFSQRYADAQLLGHIDAPDIRKQDQKNRQNSTDDIPQHIKRYWTKVIEEHFDRSIKLYDALLHDGVAKECARFILPLATPTKLYMTGSIRSWIHYIELRSANGTQKEHMDIANSIKDIFVEQLPIISEALGWNHD